MMEMNKLSGNANFVVVVDEVVVVQADVAAAVFVVAAIVVDAAAVGVVVTTLDWFSFNPFCGKTLADQAFGAGTGIHPQSLSL